MKDTPVSSEKVYLVDYARTPFSRFGGSFKKIKPVDLSVLSAKPLLERNNLKFDKIDHTIFSNVLPSTTDTLYGARHLALKLGAENSSPGYSVNRLCGSGIQAMWEASNQIKLNQSSCVLVSGSENMSMAPHLTYGARFGTKYGSLKSADLLFDTLTDQNGNIPMGITAENLAKDYKISREECESFSIRSHVKAIKAYEDNCFKSTIIESCGANKDENLRDSLVKEELMKLNSSFQEGGVVTPATASAIVDGSASCLIASKTYINNNNLKALVEIVGFSVVGVDPSRMGIGPVPAIKKILEENQLKVDDIDLFEINEAFASQALACIKELKINLDKVNIWGGSIGIGHPLGATGIRISGVLANQMQKLNKKWGIASACIGGGQGIAVLLKNAKE